MGFFNFFKKLPVIADSYFGELKLVNGRSSDKYFEGNVLFSPGGYNVGIEIDASGNEPTEWQREFYQNLQVNFNQYADKIKPLIMDEFRNWKDDFEIIDFIEEFDLEYIHIPKEEASPLIWEMAFTSVHDLNHIFTIDFIGYEPNGVLIDG